MRFSVTLIALALVAALGASARPAYADERLGVIAGSVLPTELAHFADPGVVQGFSGGMQASLGASSKANVFGYDSLTATLRWTPGTNWLGMRLSLMFGSANWYTPPLASVYRSEVLSAEERGTGASVVNTAVLGVSFRLFGIRDPMRNKDVWVQNRKRLAGYDLQLAQLGANEAIKRESLTKLRNSFLWTNILRGIARTPTLIAGALFRVGALGNSSDVEAVDAFASFAGGRGIADVMLNGHYLHNFKDALVTSDAINGSASLFLDLANSPAPPVLGLTAGAGYYFYAPRTAMTTSGEIIESAPRTTRLDLAISFSGAPDSAGAFSAGVSLRYGLLLHSEAPLEHQLLLSISSGFRFSR